MVTGIIIRHGKEPSSPDRRAYFDGGENLGSIGLCVGACKSDTPGFLNAFGGPISLDGREVEPPGKMFQGTTIEISNFVFVGKTENPNNFLELHRFRGRHEEA